MPTKKKQLEITRNGMLRVSDACISPSRVEGLEDTMQTVTSITSKFDILEQKMNINEKKDRRRNWTNPRRYRSSGNSRKA